MVLSKFLTLSKFSTPPLPLLFSLGLFSAAGDRIVGRATWEEMGNASSRDGMEESDSDDPSCRSRSYAGSSSNDTRYVRSEDSFWPTERPSRSRSPLMFAPQVAIWISLVYFLFCLAWYVLMLLLGN